MASPRNTLLDEQRVEGDKQIEVESSQIPHWHNAYIEMPFPSWSFLRQSTQTQLRSRR